MQRYRYSQKHSPHRKNRTNIIFWVGSRLELGICGTNHAVAAMFRNRGNESEPQPSQAIRILAGGELEVCAPAGLR